MRFRNLAALGLAMTLLLPGRGEDWPMARHDPSRSGRTSESLPLPLVERWSVAPPVPPRPAWPVPQPAWPEWPKLDFDHAHHAILIGDALYFGSSVDGGIHAHDAATGARRWTFFTGAPVRLAPVWADGRLYAGSDDGMLYCLDAASGRLIWSDRPVPDSARILGAGRVMSLWPIRTDALVDGGVVYVGVGIFPTRGTEIRAYDARTGTRIWRTQAVPKGANLTLAPQGYLLASPDQLYVLNGRTVPLRYARADGQLKGGIENDYDIVKAKGVVSGGYGTLAEDRLLFGSQNILHVYDAEGKHIGALRDARQIVITSNRIFQLTGLPLPRTGEKGGQNAVLAFARAPGSRPLPSGTPLWRFPADRIQTLIVAGRQVVAGADGAVYLLDAETGQKLWSSRVEGRALGLAAGNGRLAVSTDTGRIHVFGQGPKPIAPLSSAPSSSVLPADSTTEAHADFLVRDGGVTRGCVLLIGPESVRLALALSRKTDLTIHVLETEATRVSEERRALLEAGLYGSRIIVDDGSSGDVTNRLPYPPFMANLVVWQPDREKGNRIPPSLVFRRVKPCGGVLYVQGATTPHEEWKEAGEVRTLTLGGASWLRVVRGRLPGSGDWTHQWADPGNTSCSGDRLMRGKPDVLWYGEPGPDKMPDRHRRNEAPLILDGRVYAEGFRTLDQMPLLMSFDAYNGVFYWEREFPEASRLDILSDCGNMALSSNGLFVAVQNRCVRLDRATGETLHTFPVPGDSTATGRGEWAYVGTVGNTLVGSEYDGYQFSRSLFAYDIPTGRLKWHYRGGVIRNATVAIHEGTVFFVEHRGQTRAPVVLRPLERIAAEAARRRGLSSQEANPADEATAAALKTPGPPIRTVVALDLETGRERWSREVDLTGCGSWTGALCLMAKDGILVLCGIYTAYGKRTGEEPNRRAMALSAKDGTVLWNRPIGNLVRPVIIGDWLVSRPNAFLLKSGEPVMVPSGNRQKPWSIMPLGACGQMSASHYNLFYRYGVTVSMNVENGSLLMSFAGLRPGCLINIIPAAGLAVQVEASSGCTCYHALQSTVVFMPSTFR